MPKNLPDHWSGGQRSTIPCKGGELEIEAKAPKELESLAHHSYANDRPPGSFSCCKGR